ncbi:hypothetical protein G2494_00010 [Escherichia phage vB_EcoM_G2494]|nr:hypothetical protein G2494_00010 [Escherichia phage vB_EcoM_G2494]WPK33445.1 hypothetical protein [Escherichia phage AV108]
MMIIDELDKLLCLDAIVTFHRDKIHADYAQHVMSFRHKVQSVQAMESLLINVCNYRSTKCNLVLDKNDLELFRHIAEDI